MNNQERDDAIAELKERVSALESKNPTPEPAAEQPEEPKPEA